MIFCFSQINLLSSSTPTLSSTIVFCYFVLLFHVIALFITFVLIFYILTEFVSNIPIHVIFLSSLNVLWFCLSVIHSFNMCHPFFRTHNTQIQICFLAHFLVFFFLSHYRVIIVLLLQVGISICACFELKFRPFFHITRYNIFGRCFVYVMVLIHRHSCGNCSRNF